MTAAEWEPIADRLASAYPASDFGAERRAEYLEALGAFGAEAVASAVDALVRETRSAPPSAPVIRQAVLRAGRPGPRTPAPEPGLAIQRARIYGLSFLSSAVSALALILLVVWWLWARG